jgi:predicted GIY-YIG superfamily endonuclease
MGPADISDMSSTTNTQVLNLPKLRSDGSNWSTYQERILNYVTSKGLKRHLLDTTRKPVELREQDGLFYKGITPDPLTEEEIEEHEGEEDKYEQQQAAVRKVIYRTVDKSTFLQVKKETTAAAIWKKVISIHADKGSMYETNLLTQLQTL